MKRLTTKERGFLRSLAHPLKPVLHIGKEGLTGAALRVVSERFNTRELLKIKVLESAPEGARETGRMIEEHLGDVQTVQVIGRTVVLYRKHPEKPDIKLLRRQVTEA